MSWMKIPAPEHLPATEPLEPTVVTVDSDDEEEEDDDRPRQLQTYLIDGTILEEMPEPTKGENAGVEVVERPRVGRGPRRVRERASETRPQPVAPQQQQHPLPCYPYLDTPETRSSYLADRVSSTLTLRNMHEMAYAQGIGTEGPHPVWWSGVGDYLGVFHSYGVDQSTWGAPQSFPYGGLTPWYVGPRAGAGVDTGIGTSGAGTPGGGGGVDEVMFEQQQQQEE